MFERVTMVFKAMIDALLGKVEDPQMMLDSRYAERQSLLIALRRDLSELLAREARLQRQIAELELKEAQLRRQVVADEMSNSELSQLKRNLKEVRAEIAKLVRKLLDLGDEVRNAYTAKQVLIAREKAGQATLLATDAILVGKAITEDGLTYDYELNHGSERTQNDDLPIWLPIIMLAVILILLMTVVLQGQPLFVFDFAGF